MAVYQYITVWDWMTWSHSDKVLTEWHGLWLKRISCEWHILLSFRARFCEWHKLPFRANSYSDDQLNKNEQPSLTSNYWKKGFKKCLYLFYFQLFSLLSFLCNSITLMKVCKSHYWQDYYYVLNAATWLLTYNIEENQELYKYPSNIFYVKVIIYRQYIRISDILIQ